MDAVKTAPRLRVPVLYLAAEGDDNAGFDFSQDAEAMHAATAAADKRLEVLPGSLHGIAPHGRLGASEGRSSRASSKGTEPRRRLRAAAWECASHRGR